jgi:hypothetical protein
MEETRAGQEPRHPTPNWTAGVPGGKQRLFSPINLASILKFRAFCFNGTQKKSNFEVEDIDSNFERFSMEHLSE